MLNEKDLNMHSLEACCMISTSQPLNLLGESRVTMETSVEEAEHHKDSTNNSSLGKHERNKEKGVCLEELK